MMFIVYGEKEDCMQWHVGEPLPKEIDPTQVSEVQADGNELKWIEENFRNLPYPGGSRRMKLWFGDLAKLIVGAIPLK